MFGVALLAGRKAKGRAPAPIIRFGFGLLTLGLALLIPFVPRVHSGWALVLPLIITGSGLGLLVSQLNNFTLGPIDEERVSEAAGVNSAAGSFGLSFGLACSEAILLATLSVAYTKEAENSTVLPPAQKSHIADVLDEDAEVMTNTQLEELIAEEPPAVREEVVSINTDTRPLALQIALLVPLIAGLAGFANSFRMPTGVPAAAGGGERSARLET
jgi:hypothetical protein